MELIWFIISTLNKYGTTILKKHIIKIGEKLKSV